MALGARKLRSVMTFKNDDEARAWVRFAAGASAACAGGGDDAKEDADETAEFADEILKHYRERQP